MKKLFSLLLALALVCSLAAAPAWAEKEYGLTIAGTKVTDSNAADILGNGVFAVDDDGHTNYEDFLYMNGSAIFNFTLETVPPLMKSLLAKSGLEKADVDYFVFHQANKYMLSTLRKVCGIPADKFYVDLEETGNTVSSTILIGLKECLETGKIASGAMVMICGFGVGLSYGTCLLQF